MSEWDYIVVGAGSAGCAVAHELVADGTSRVLLMEAGGPDRSAYIRIPGFVALAGKHFDWGYRCQSDVSRGGKIDNWRRGYVLGGCSSINGMLYVRPAQHDFDAWAELGNHGWSYSDVLPLLREMESSDQPDGPRGHQGPLFVRTIRRGHRLTRAFIDSAVAAGFAFNPDYNSGMQEGVAYAQLSQRWGLRWSAADAFVRPLLKRKNFKLLLNARVERIEFSGTKASGVRCLYEGTSRAFSAKRVILCAGAINSPKILMHSGIGDSAELRRHDIPTLVDAPEVGRNLRDHPLIRLIYRTRIPSNNPIGVMQRLRIAGAFVRFREGPIAAPIEAVGFLKTSPELRHPDIQLHFVTLATKAANQNAAPLMDYSGICVYVNPNYSQSRSRVCLASADFADPPLIDSNILGDPADLDVLVRGTLLVRRIMATAPIADLICEESAPGPACDSMDALAEYIPRNTEIAYSAIGTCRMGIDSGAVVTPDLRVVGTENLWVADASIMPSHISGNANAMCMLIGKKLGRQVAAHGMADATCV